MCKNRFIYANDDREFFNYAFELAPFCRVLFVATERYFLHFGKRIVSALTEKQLKVTTVLYTNGEKISVERLSGIFNVADDVRLIISFEEELFYTCFYFASIRKIPTFVSVDIELLDFATKNSENFFGEPFFFYDERYIYCKTIGEIKELYFAIILKRLSLIDYKIKCIVHKKNYHSQYYAAVKILEDFNYETLSKNVLLSVNKKLCELNYDANGQLYDCGVISDAKAFFKVSNLECIYLAKEYFVFILENINKPFNSLPDYNERAEKLSKIISVPSFKIRENLKKQLEYIEKNKLLVDLSFNLLKDSLNSIISFIDSSIKTCLENEKTTKKVEMGHFSFITLSCDNLKHFNSATLVREYIGC